MRWDDVSDLAGWARVQHCQVARSQVELSILRSKARKAADSQRLGANLLAKEGIALDARDRRGGLPGQHVILANAETRRKQGQQ
jgi:hypothetical protein